MASERRLNDIPRQVHTFSGKQWPDHPSWCVGVKPGL